MSDNINFEWIPANDSILVNSQPSIAIYENPWGQVVIRQERTPLEPDDQVVLVNIETVPLLIERMQHLLKTVERRPVTAPGADIVEFPRTTRATGKGEVKQGVEPGDKPGSHSEATA